MTWSKRCDLCDEHPKIKALDDRAYRFWNILVNYAARHETDGHIDDAAIEYARTLMGLKRPTVAVILAQCERNPAGYSAGLLERNGETWILHDFLDYHPPREKLDAERKANVERQRRWREKSKRNAVTGVKNGPRNGVNNDAPTRPDPPLKGGGERGPEGAAPPEDDDEQHRRLLRAGHAVAELRVFGEDRDRALRAYRKDPSRVGAAIRAAEDAADFLQRLDVIEAAGGADA
jgi:hypothetical protein